jgi:16S rRNA (cytidine1402-2'-O)-methyltransferase
MAAVREISKKFEECVRGTIAEVLAHFTEHEPKGEFVLIVEGAPQMKNKDKKKKDNHKGRDEE